MAAELAIQNRTVFGKRVRRLRGEGFVPGEIYGHNIPNRHVSVNAKDFLRAYHEAGKHAIVTLTDATGERIPALIAYVDRHPISREFLAVDFRQIRMDEKIQTSIPLLFTGEAPVLQQGLIVIRVLDRVEIESLPAALPDHFEVDLSKLEQASQSIHVKDLAIPEGVKVLVSEDTVIATVSERQKEEVAAAPAAPAAAEEETIETEREAPAKENGEIKKE